MMTARALPWRRVTALIAASALAAGLSSACDDADDPARAEGSGSTFARQAFNAWCDASDACTYRAVGSGAGVEDVVEQTTEFGASDVPLTPDEEQAFERTAGEVAPEGTAPVQVPVLIGAITVATNVRGIDYSARRLRFSGRTLARIFSGEITGWDDPRLAADNPGVRFPAERITRCVRKDSSGTSAVFTDFLSQADPAFGRTVGVSRLPEWPGSGVERFPGNEGVGACLQDRDNAIGYIDLADGVTLFGEGAPPERVFRLAEVGVERDGATEWVAPTTASTALAGTAGLGPGTPLTSYGSRILNAPVADAYPIAATTYLIVHDRYADPETCDEVVETARWALSPRGQKALSDAYYAPVGPEVRSRSLEELAAVRDGGGNACASR
jgi:phosphate transport system substrate-binding protein